MVWPTMFVPYFRGWILARLRLSFDTIVGEPLDFMWDLSNTVDRSKSIKEALWPLSKANFIMFVISITAYSVPWSALNPDWEGCKRLEDSRKDISCVLTAFLIIFEVPGNCDSGLKFESVSGSACGFLSSGRILAFFFSGRTIPEYTEEVKSFW